MAKLEIDLPPCPECGGTLEAQASPGRSQVIGDRLEIAVVVTVHCLECGWLTPAP